MYSRQLVVELIIDCIEHQPVAAAGHGPVDIEAAERLGDFIIDALAVPGGLAEVMQGEQLGERLRRL